MKERNPYSAPKLVRFGSIVLLTQGAAGSGTDGGSAYMNRNGGNDGGGPPAMNMTMSDRRCKENLVPVGVHPRGFKLYLFDYKEAFRHQQAGMQVRQFGVVAQEVVNVMPEAVHTDAEGIKQVNYRLLGIVH